MASVVDEGPSTAYVELDVGGTEVKARLTGPFVIERKAPSGDTIPVEMVSMSLTGVVADGPFKDWRLSIDLKKRAPGTVFNPVFNKQGDLIGGGPGEFTFEEGSLAWTKEDPRGQKFEGIFSKLSVGTDNLYSLPPNVPVERRVPVGEHYKCYGMKVRKGFAARSFKLADQFESADAKLVRPLTLCAPVRKNGEKLRFPSAHLKCYSISSSSRKPKKAEVEVGVTNQFGSQDLVVLKPLTLCAPTLKKRQKQVPKPRPPTGPLPTIEHFKCYDVRPKTGFAPRTVALEDQFEIERARVLRPVSLCDPVQKNALRIRDSQTHLVCYAIRDTSRKLKPGGRFVVVRNQFGVEELIVLKPQTLCVPSTKKPPCSEYAERTKAALLLQGTQVGTLNKAIHIPFEGVKDSPCE